MMNDKKITLSKHRKPTTLLSYLIEVRSTCKIEKEHDFFTFRPFTFPKPLLPPVPDQQRRKPRNEIVVTRKGTAHARQVWEKNCRTRSQSRIRNLNLRINWNDKDNH